MHIGSPAPYYITGNDVVYAYSPIENGEIDILVTNNGGGTGFFVLQACPFISNLGGSTSPYPNTDLLLRHLPVIAGETYYIVVSSWSNPQTTNFTLSITETVYDCPDLGVDFGTPCDDQNPLSAYDVINEDCQCAGQLGFNCAAAIPLECNAGPVTNSSVNSNATAPPNDCTAGTRGLYYTFTGTGGEVTISASANFNLAVFVEHGVCGVNGTDVACYAQDHNVSINLGTTILGEPYYVYVAQNLNGFAMGDITVNLICYPIPENDDCQNATLISCDQSVEGTTIGATHSDLSATYMRIVRRL